MCDAAQRVLRQRDRAAGRPRGRGARHPAERRALRRAGPVSRNRGEVDHRACSRASRRPVRQRRGPFQLFRIGDAVASRNIHAAAYDALRLCSADLTDPRLKGSETMTRRHRRGRGDDRRRRAHGHERSRPCPRAGRATSARPSSTWTSRRYGRGPGCSSATEAEVREPGDFVTVDIGPYSVIVLRDDDEEVRALHNVCRHRGARLLTDRAGSVGNIVCGYHRWTYATDGSLLHAGDQRAGLRQVLLRPAAGARPRGRRAGLHQPGRRRRRRLRRRRGPRVAVPAARTSCAAPRWPRRSTWSRTRTGSW